MSAQSGAVSVPDVGTADEIRRPGRFNLSEDLRLAVGLAVLLSWQLMVVLDGTIVNIALAHIRESLGFSATGLSWVVNAYALAFGGLLMLGSRMGDIFGRRRMMIAGVIIFTGASAIGGFADSPSFLIGARVLQGVGAALAAPSTLSLIVSNYEAGPARNRALSLFASVSGVGASMGLILGGVLTSWLSWHWVFFVNVPIGIAIALLTPQVVREAPRTAGSLDVAGTATSTIGVTALVYGFIRAAEQGWSDAITLASFAVAVILLGSFVAIERRASQPILPFRLINERTRAIGFLSQLLVPATLFGVFFFLTQYLQVVLEMSAVQSGFAFLPFSATIVLGSRFVPRAAARFGMRSVLMYGGFAIATGLVMMANLDETASYFPLVMLSMLVMASGAVSGFVGLSLLIMGNMSPEDSGSASGLMQTNQQIGGAIGLAVLVTVFGTVSRSAEADGSSQIQAMVDGMHAGFYVAAGIALVVFLLVTFGLRTQASDND